MDFLKWVPKPGGRDSSLGRRKTPPTRSELLALKPLRNPDLEWSEMEGHVVLHVKHRPTQASRMLGALFPLPSDRHVELDAIGTDVWQMLDGETSIGRIAKAVALKYKITAREAELSLQQFFKELGRRGYVGFAMEQSRAGAADVSTNGRSKGVAAKQQSRGVSKSAKAKSSRGKRKK